jgi:phosphatidylglycerophosphatase A
MSANPDAAVPNAAADPQPSSRDATVQRKPRFALFIATACGLGYMPVAPGTWGSLAGVLIYFLIRSEPLAASFLYLPSLTLQLSLCALIAVPLGIWTADHVARYSALKDPQFVVIDEVSGQLFAYALALTPTNWKYLLLGFILFRIFDIWKPFPARQAESLPGGWGIMADDWVAGIYAAIGLWIARAAGL